jgi:hypothetical protein
MALVTISRQFGAGGRTLGERLCERFSFRLVDEFVVDELARKAKVSTTWLTGIEKEASSTLLSTISDIVSSGLFYRTPAAPGEGYERQKYIAFLTKIYTAMAQEGGYVIIGRGSQFVLKDHPQVLCVLLVSRYESRVSFIMDRYGLSRVEVESIIREKEKQRAALASRLFQADIDNPDLYHIVLNTSLMPFEWAVEAVSQMLTRLIDRK